MGSKKFPWWKTGDTVASADDLDKFSDYLYSGGQFTDIEQPLMYMKRVLCMHLLISFLTALNLRIDKEKANPAIDLLIKTLKEVILARIPRHARLTQMIDRAVTMGRMGKGGPNLDSFTDQLILEMEQCQWSSMTVTEVTILFWLKDIDSSDKDQEELGKLVNKAWDEAEK